MPQLEANKGDPESLFATLGQAGANPPPHQNRAVEAAQVIEELIQLARELREATARGEKLGLSENELAFYDALETNDSAVQVLGDETLRASSSTAPSCRAKHNILGLPELTG